MAQSPQLNDSQLNLLAKIAANTGETQPKHGDGQHNLLFKIAQNTYASAVNSSSDRILFKAITAPVLNATTTLTPITGLDWTAQANSEYLAEWGLFCDDGGNGDFDGQVTAPTGATIYGKWIYQDIVNSDTISTPDNLTLRIKFLDADQDIYFSNQKAYITTGSTAGTVSFQFAKDVTGITHVANEIATGSWVRVEKVS